MVIIKGAFFLISNTNKKDLLFPIDLSDFNHLCDHSNDGLKNLKKENKDSISFVILF